MDQETIGQIAQSGGMDAALLRQYTVEDMLDGYEGPKSRWPGMSISAEEGQILYAIVRYFKPRRVLEIGVWDGCSTCHILSAMQANNFGKLISIDVAGHIIPKVPLALHMRWLPVVADALIHPLPYTDIVFEDGAHTYDFTRSMLLRLIEKPRCVIVGHDVLYPGWGEDVLRAYREVLPDCKMFGIGKSPRGMVFWFRRKLNET